MRVLDGEVIVPVTNEQCDVGIHCIVYNQSTSLLLGTLPDPPTRTVGTRVRLPTTAGALFGVCVAPTCLLTVGALARLRWCEVTFDTGGGGGGVAAPGPCSAAVVAHVPLPPRRVP